MPANRFPTSPAAMLACLWTQRGLVAQLVRREVVGRYRGSLLGLLWSLTHPLLLLAMFTFVFGTVIPARWSTLGDAGGHAEFALVLFPGMIVHALLAECLNRAPSLISETPNFVKKVVFPLELLPAVALGGALFHALVSFAILVVAYAAVHSTVHVTIVALPLVLLPYVALALGLTWFFAALGVYLRDVGQVMGVVTMALMFLAPVFYPITAIPPAWRPLVYANPITLIVLQVRDTLVFGRWPHWPSLAAYAAVAFAVACFGFWWFQKSRKGFADVV
jgi:lipopolysaccharide transport system permease protein